MYCLNEKRSRVRAEAGVAATDTDLANNAAFTLGHMSPDTSCIHLSPSTVGFLYRRQNCRQFVARLLLDTKAKGYKSIVT